MTKAKLSCTHPIMKLIQLIEWLGLLLITIATVIAVIQEVSFVVGRKHVELHDILLFFIYLEVIAMVALYLTSGKLPVRYPIYIAIVAIARFIILELKILDSLDVIWLSISMLILTFAALVLRFGHANYPYEERAD
jgi:protein PsiE